MFKIIALLCVIGVNGQNLCLTGEIPLTNKLKTEEDCNNTIVSIGQNIDEEFIERQIFISMKCEKIGDKV